MKLVLKKRYAIPQRVRNTFRLGSISQCLSKKYIPYCFFVTWLPTRNRPRSCFRPRSCSAGARSVPAGRTLVARCSRGCSREARPRAGVAGRLQVSNEAGNIGQSDSFQEQNCQFLDVLAFSRRDVVDGQCVPNHFFLLLVHFMFLSTNPRGRTCRENLRPLFYKKVSQT